MVRCNFHNATHSPPTTPTNRFGRGSRRHRSWIFPSAKFGLQRPRQIDDQTRIELRVLDHPRSPSLTTSVFHRGVACVYRHAEGDRVQADPLSAYKREAGPVGHGGKAKGGQRVATSARKYAAIVGARLFRPLVWPIYRRHES